MIINISNLCAKSAGLSDEQTNYVECIVDPKATQQPELEATEDIRSFWKTPLQLINYVNTLDKEKYSVAADVWSFILGTRL